MQSVHGYYDGQAFQALEQTTVQENQKVIITIMDDFVEGRKKKKDLSPEEREALIKKLYGSLSHYADPEKRKLEEGAWERAAVEKHQKFLKEHHI